MSWIALRSLDRQVDLTRGHPSDLEVRRSNVTRVRPDGVRTQKTGPEGVKTRRQKGFVKSESAVSQWHGMVESDIGVVFTKWFDRYPSRLRLQ